MTRNNLREHLHWLVSSKPFAPPLPGPTPRAGKLSPTQTDPLYDSLEAELLGPTTTLSSPIHVAGGRIDHAGREFDFARPLLPASSYNTGKGKEMARLQSGPRSNTKRLLSHTSPDPLQTPTPCSARRPSTSLKDQYTAAYEQGNNSKSCED